MTERRTPPVGRVRFGDLGDVRPIARRFGFDRGQPVDRYYIEGFLGRHALAIRGRVLEIGGDDYTRAFGKSRVTTSDVLDLNPENAKATIVADLTQADQLPPATFDCIICTQTLQLIYEVRSAVATLHRLLKPGGSVLATMPGISQTDDEAWAPHWCWSFTPVSARRLFGEAFPGGQVVAASHGNVLAATAFLHGLATRDVRPQDLEREDPAFPFLVSVLAVKAVEGREAEAGSVSVVIPCFNQAAYVGEAIESATSQAPHVTEVIVVDDGSTDETAEVCRRYAAVRYVRQANQGLPRARNAGLEVAVGRFVVFLDADDRLCPGALERGVSMLRERPDRAFVSGEHRYISPSGEVLQEWSREPVRSDHYLALLRSNYVGMIATAMFRRDVFDEVGAFDAGLRACEDYDLYLRIARRFPVGSHDQLVAEYRRHADAMSANTGRMLAAALLVLDRQRPFTRGWPDREAALAEGVAYWRSYYAKPSETGLFGRLLDGISQRLRSR